MLLTTFKPCYGAELWACLADCDWMSSSTSVVSQLPALVLHRHS